METIHRGVRALAALPLPLRRRLLRTIWQGGALVRPGMARFGIEGLIGRSLRTGRGDARRIDREMHFHDKLQDLEWVAAAFRSKDEMISEAGSIAVEDVGLFARLAATGEPVILAPIHMGNFPLGLAHLLHRFFDGRRLLVLRAREDLPVWDVAMRRLGEVASELRIVNIADKASFVEAMRFARNKGAVTICFSDLPATYGTPAEVELFGEPASIAFGLDALARMVKGVVVPVAVQSAVDGDLVVAGQPFEVETNSQGERARLAGLMARQLERFVYAAPAQWHMWTRLHEFRIVDGSEELSDGVA